MNISALRGRWVRFAFVSLRDDAGVATACYQGAAYAGRVCGLNRVARPVWPQMGCGMAS